MDDISLHITDVSHCSDDTEAVELSDFTFKGLPCNLSNEFTMYAGPGSQVLSVGNIYLPEVFFPSIPMAVHRTEKKTSLKTSITNLILPVDKSCTFTSQEIQSAGESIIAVPNADCKSQKSNIVKTTRKYENFDSQSLKNTFNSMKDHGEKDSRICSGEFSKWFFFICL